MLSKRAPARPGHSRLVSVDQSIHQPSRSGAHVGAEIGVARLRLADAAAELGTLLGALGEHREAEPLLRQAVDIFESCGGPDQARLAGALSALGTACAARGRLDEAERLCRRALQIIDTRALERS